MFRTLFKFVLPYIYVYHEDNQLLSQTNLPRKGSYHGAIKTTMLM
jgi:hypothetical protein